MKNSWVNLVYDIYEFLYWEPQHIGKQKNVTKKSYKDIINNVKNLEVTLNQIFNIFFTFLPQKYIIGFMRYIFKDSIINDNFKIYLDGDDKINGIKGATQPDILIEGNLSNIYIEMKINAKMNLGQYFKYILLHTILETQEGKKKKMFLIILSKSSFSQVWKEKYQNFETLKTDFEQYQIPVKTKKGNIDIGKYLPRIKEIGEEVNLSHITYNEIHSYFKRKMETESDERIKYLFEGLIKELEFRKII